MVGHSKSVGWPASYLLIEVPIEEEPEPAAFALFAWRFSFRDLLAAVFELFEPPLSLLAMVAPSGRRDSGAERSTLEPNEESGDTTGSRLLGRIAGLKF